MKDVLLWMLFPLTCGAVLAVAGMDVRKRPLVTIAMMLALVVAHDLTAGRRNILADFITRCME